MNHVAHRNSISKRSSVHSQGSIDPVRNRGRPPNNKINQLSHGRGEVKNTVSRLEYLNRKFNADSSFEIEISGHDDGKDEERDPNEKAQDQNDLDPTPIETKFVPELMNIDVMEKEKGVEAMSRSLDMSIELLSPLYEYIQNFEMNLNKLSNEMEVLQTRLLKLNEEIEKNTIMDKKLTPVLQDLLISPQCIKILLGYSLDEKWTNQLVILQEKKEILISYKEKNEVNDDNLDELFALIEKLEAKCLERIKLFLIENIKSLRSVNASSVKIQGKLLKVKYIINFLKSKNNKLAKEFELAYVYTIRWYYYFNFVKYISSLEGLKILENDYDDEGGNSGTTHTSNSRITSNYTPPSLLLDNSNSINEYLINLPRRYELLNDENNRFAILAQIAESSSKGNSNMKFFMEQIFQFLNQTLIDNLTIEFNFIVEFFMLKDNEEMNHVIRQIFTPILKMGTNFTTYLIGYCRSDYFGILHTIRRIQKMEYEIQNRCLPELFENYLNSQLLLLWPIFQRNIDTLCNSITLTLNSTLVIKQVVNNKNNILIPLKLTQSFSMVLSNLVKLVQNLVLELETIEPLNISIERLSNTYERGIVQLANSLDSSKGRLFLYVNYQLVYNVLDNEMEPSGLSADHEPAAIGETLCQHYKQLVQSCS